MKIIGRTLAILAFAAAIVGGLLALGTSTSLASGGGRPEFAAAAQAQTDGTTSASDASGTSTAAPPHREGDQGASLFGIVEVLKNLAIVGVITAIVAGGKRLVGRGRAPRPPAQRPHAAA